MSGPLIDNVDLDTVRQRYQLALANYRHFAGRGPTLYVLRVAERQMWATGLGEEIERRDGEEQP